MTILFFDGPNAVKRWRRRNVKKLIQSRAKTHLKDVVVAMFDCTADQRALAAKGVYVISL